MVRPQRLLLLAGMAAAAIAVVRHGRRAARGHQVPGGMLIGDGFVDDTLSRLLLSSLLRGIAGDIRSGRPRRRPGAGGGLRTRASVDPTSPSNSASGGRRCNAASISRTVIHSE